MALKPTFSFASELCHNSKYRWVTLFASKERDQWRLSSLADPLRPTPMKPMKNSYKYSLKPHNPLTLKPTFSFASVLCHNSEYGWVTSFGSKERDQRRLSSSADPLRPFIPLVRLTLLAEGSCQSKLITLINMVASCVQLSCTLVIREHINGSYLK